MSGISHTRRPTTAATLGAATLGVLLVLSGCAAAQVSQMPSFSANPTRTPTQSAEQPRPNTTSPVDLARAALNQLPVKGRAPKTGYARDQFGQRWSDDVEVEFGHNGCDTRNDILSRDLSDRTYKPNTRDCVVMSGQLADPYTGAVIDFQRGQGSSNAVQIDHVVALSDAWQKGAQLLSPEARRNFANDPLNLLAVDGPANQQKRDGDAATWLPANSAFRCQYVARQTAVKLKYQLWVTPAEHDAIVRWLDTCTSEDDTALSAIFTPGLG